MIQKTKAFWGVGVFAAGAVSVFAFAPFCFFPAIWLSLAIFLVGVLYAPDAKAAGLLGFLYGLGFYLANIHWIYITLHVYGGVSTIIAIGLLVIFSSYLGLFSTLAAYFSYKISCTSSVRLLIILPALLTLSEWVRGTLFTGFPWALIGYTHISSVPLAGFTPIIGVYGLSFLVILSVALVIWGGMFAKQSYKVALIILGSLWGIGWGLQFIDWTKPTGEPLTVSVVQGNIPQSLKWKPEVFTQTVNTYLALLERSTADVIILPETAIPLFLQFLPQAILEQFQNAAKGKALIVGIPSLDEETNQYYNSAVLLTQPHLPSYHKYHLVPFGEYVPLPFLTRPVIDSLHIPLNDFAKGAAVQLPFKVRDQFIAMNVCYEDIFGAEIANNAPLATLLANISNLAWFEGSIAMAQHGQIAQARALETGRPMVRATNTGLTALIDHRGQFIKQAPLEKEAILTAKIQGRTGMTPYMKVKDWGILTFLIGWLLVGLMLSRRHKNQPCS